MSAGRQEAFDHFRRDNPLNQKLDEHKRILKQRYTEAKTLGEEINQSRNRISNKHFLLLFWIMIILFSRSFERTI
jgi:kinesin family protein 6/9